MKQFLLFFACTMISSCGPQRIFPNTTVPDRTSILIHEQNSYPNADFQLMKRFANKLLGNKYAIFYPIDTPIQWREVDGEIDLSCLDEPRVTEFYIIEKAIISGCESILIHKRVSTILYLNPKLRDDYYITKQYFLKKGDLYMSTYESIARKSVDDTNIYVPVEPFGTETQVKHRKRLLDQKHRISEIRRYMRLIELLKSSEYTHLQPLGRLSTIENLYYPLSFSD